MLDKSPCQTVRVLFSRWWVVQVVLGGNPGQEAGELGVHWRIVRLLEQLRLGVLDIIIIFSRLPFSKWKLRASLNEGWKMCCILYSPKIICPRKTVCSPFRHCLLCVSIIGKPKRPWWVHFFTLPLINDFNPEMMYLDWSSLTISGEPDSPEVGQNWFHISLAQIVPGG